MADPAKPYWNRCARCGDGLLRPACCGECGAVVALCDECELIWRDVEAVSQGADSPADGTYPDCPCCGAAHAAWRILSLEELRERRLDRWVRGCSP